MIFTPLSFHQTACASALALVGPATLTSVPAASRPSAGMHHGFCAMNACPNYAGVTGRTDDNRWPGQREHTSVSGLTSSKGGAAVWVYLRCCSSVHQPSHFPRSSPTCHSVQGSTEFYSSSRGSLPKGSASRAPAPPLHRSNDARLSRKSQGCLGRWGAVPVSPAVTGSLPSFWGTTLPSGSLLCPSNTLVGGASFLPFSCFAPKRSYTQSVCQRGLMK